MYGADLPIALKEAFLEKAQDHWVRPSELAEAARSLVRSFNLPRHPQNYRLNDAFYQLALHAGVKRGLHGLLRGSHEGEVANRGLFSFRSSQRSGIQRDEAEKRVSRGGVPSFASNAFKSVMIVTCPTTIPTLRNIFCSIRNEGTTPNS